ncbi:MAG: sulfatase-like hydrolase/transferase [Opitutaceae bacterium]
MHTRLLALLCLLAPVLSAAAPAKPNIIFILGDDVGIGDIACTGADRYKTPNIDALARGGTIFRHAYAEPLCGPSRATILTGRYVFRTGATNQDATGRFTPKAETMMPAILKQAGYITSSIGKWGQLPLGPADFGFDDYFRFSGSGAYWKSQGKKGENVEINGKKVPVGEKDYIPELMHAHLVDFMTKNRARPFYVYYSLSHVHTDILPTPDSAPGSQTLYADNVAYMDKLVGKLTRELERLGLRENTLLVYFGDNGTTNGQSDAATIGGRRLNGSKGSMLEGGSRVPMVVNWPGVTPAGRIANDLIDSSDFVPTFAALAGAPLPAGKVIDGRSFAPQVRGQNAPGRDWVFIQLAKKWYVADRQWKLTESGELFDLSDAPFTEKPGPAAGAPAAAVAARARLQAALDQLNPMGGFIDDGDGTGRHANREENRANRKKKNN